MGDNSFGNVFKITSFGESHGKVIGIIIDGVPAGLTLDMKFMQEEVNKRKPGQSKLTTSRSELDQIEILSGVFNNSTTGAPICMIVRNKDIDSSKYEKFKHILRPSHIDFVALKKYGGFSDYRGSGRFSGRITAGFVMAGAVAKLLLKRINIEVFAYTKSIGDISDEKTPQIEHLEDYKNIRENSLVRAIDLDKSKMMEGLIEQVGNNKDSIGGTINCVINNVPIGIGDPIFNSLESNLSKAMFSIPAIKGIEFGAGFKAAKMRGSEHNDPWTIKDGKIITTKNDSGGIIGGISTGMPIYFSVAVKPTASIGLPQKTVDIKQMRDVELEYKGRHDPCIVPRAVVVIEAMTAITLCDFLLKDGLIAPVL
ncbi:MAG: chorismate synthase [Candidatus Lokiarchaeota archaeon]|nr:chorismate synthase [Candidatus Lokiarchaeota archaeon]MBD3341311.1 chorismate synthase [Candidatus Lokiarchaeota archaeon]